MPRRQERNERTETEQSGRPQGKQGRQEVGGRLEEEGWLGAAPNPRLQRTRPRLRFLLNPNSSHLGLTAEARRYAAEYTP